MIYWVSGENYNCNRVLAKKFTDFLRTEKRNWRRSVFYIDDDIATNEAAPILSNFIDTQKLDAVVVIRNYHLSDIALSDKWTEICLSKGNILSPQLTHHIQLDTEFTTVQGLFLKLIAHITD